MNATFLLGFNEPNNAQNCNQTPRNIARAWQTVLDLWGKSSILVSPATAGDGRPWLDAFFGNCTALYGPTGCQVRYVAVHDYSCVAESTLTYLQEVSARYNLPVWLTEFSCGDHAAGKPMSEHLTYMRSVVPLLDAADFVYRYAWMSARDSGGMRGLVEVDAGGAQRLTELGVAYNAL